VKFYKIVVGAGALAGVSGAIAVGCVGSLATAPGGADAGNDAALTPETGGGSDGNGLPDTGGQPPVDAGDSGSDAAVTLLDAATDAADAADAGLPLPDVAPGHLQLWLKADVGVTCANDQITQWADQSGNSRNASNGAHTGPECPTTGHAQAGTNLPFFSAPVAAAPPYNNGTLDVNLAFLDGTEFTIFVVERRWHDSPPGGNDELLVGSDFPNDTAPSCGDGGTAIDLLTFGYVYYDGFPALGYESDCYRPFTGTRGRATDASVPPPSPIVLDMFRLWEDAGASPTIWQDGVKINGGGASGGPGKGLVGGSIGRAVGYTGGDHRFDGDIAEVVIFDIGLTDAERQQMEAYFKAHWNLSF
jgi:hypothetical protein